MAGKETDRKQLCRHTRVRNRFEPESRRAFQKTAKHGAKYEQAIKTMKAGNRFIMSNVGFVEDAKLAYVSSPLKIVVDLSSTRMDACVEKPASATQPAPTAAIAGSTDLADNQFFDVTGLIQEVQEVRQHANDRSSFIVKIYDGSVDNETQKVQTMLSTILL